MLPLINPPFEYVAGKIGASPDEVKLIFSFLLSYPLASLLKRIPDNRPNQKNLFIISSSIFYLVGLFDLWDGLRTLLISSGGTYCIASIFRSSPFMPWIGFSFVMLHLSFNHIARQFNNSPEVVDITGAQMVLVMKLSAFCWNIADGQLPEDTLSDFQKDRRLPELPNLLDFVGYVFFFPGLLVGPAFDFAEYRRWVDTTMFELPDQTHVSKTSTVRRRRKIPHSGGPATWKLVSGLVWLCAFVYLSGAFDYKQMLKPSFVQHGIVRRVWILHMANFTARTKYYGVWTLTEGACILAGLGFNGVDSVTGKISWDRLRNINPLGVELAQNSRAYLGNWNINTNSWLRNYVYLRVTPKGRKPGFSASFLTFATSAVWHGFYPGYYLTFVLGSLIQTVAKNFRRYLRPLFLDVTTGLPTANKRYYDFLSYVCTQLAFSFATTPFLVLSFSDSIQVWAGVYFYAVVGIVLSLAFFASPATAYLRKAQESRRAQHGAKASASAASDDAAGHVPVLGMPPDLDETLRSELRSRPGHKG